MQRELVERAMAGDHDAFSELARVSIGRLYVVARLIVRDDNVAEDATQEALVAAWSHSTTLRDPDRFEAWLHRLLVRACYREAGRHRRRGAWRSACRSSSRPSQMTARPWPTAISSSEAFAVSTLVSGPFSSFITTLACRSTRRPRSRCRARHGPVATSPGHPRDARRARRGRPVFSPNEGRPA